MKSKSSSRNVIPMGRGEKNDEPWKNKQIKNKTFDSAFFSVIFWCRCCHWWFAGAIDSLLLFFCYDRNGFFFIWIAKKGGANHNIVDSLHFNFLTQKKIQKLTVARFHPRWSTWIIYDHSGLPRNTKQRYIDY